MMSPGDMPAAHVDPRIRFWGHHWEWQKSVKIYNWFLSSTGFVLPVVSTKGLQSVKDCRNEEAIEYGLVLGMAPVIKWTRMKQNTVLKNQSLFKD